MIHKPITAKWRILCPFTLRFDPYIAAPKVWKRKEESEKYEDADGDGQKKHVLYIIASKTIQIKIKSSLPFFVLHGGRYAHLHSLTFFPSSHTYLVLLRRAIYLHINNNKNKSHQTQAASCARSYSSMFCFSFSFQLLSFLLVFNCTYKKKVKVSQRKCLCRMYKTFLRFRLVYKNKSIIIDIECAMQVNLTSVKKPTHTNRMPPLSPPLPLPTIAIQIVYGEQDNSSRNVALINYMHNHI